MEAVGGVDDEIGIAALKGLGGLAPLAEDDAVGDVELLEDLLQQFNVVACRLAMVVAVFIGREVPVAGDDEGIVLRVVKIDLSGGRKGEKVKK